MNPKPMHSVISARFTCALTEIADIIIRIKHEQGNLWPVCLDQSLGTKACK